MNYNKCFLDVGGRLTRHDSAAAAVRSFKELARQAYRIDSHYGLTAGIHIADRRADVTDDADYLLTVGPRGGARVERVPI